MLILRNPVERAHSAFQRDRMYGRESNPDFAAAIADSRRREAEDWFIGIHRRLSLYAQHVETYLETFGPAQLKILLFEDLETDPARLMHELFEYLGVDADFVTDLSKRYNVTGSIKNPILRHLWMGSRGLRSRVMPYIPLSLRGKTAGLASFLPIRKQQTQRIEPQLRAHLINDFQDDILHLQQLIGRDLSHWLITE
jgi:hypothetical protein